MTTAYPHERDDCASCKSFDADMAVDYDGPDGDTGAGLRWCQRCAGPLLARLVLTGHTAVVRPPNGFDAEARAAAANTRARVAATAPPEDPGWTLDLAEQTLRSALPSGSTFLRALVDEGGTATPARLKELTGSDALHHMTGTLNTAARKLWTRDRTNGRLFVAAARHDPDNPRKRTVFEYTLPAELVPLWDQALRRLGR